MRRQSAALFRRDSSPCSRAAGWGVLLRRGVKTPGAYCEPCSVPLRRGGSSRNAEFRAHENSAGAGSLGTPGRCGFPGREASVRAGCLFRLRAPSPANTAASPQSRTAAHSAFSYASTPQRAQTAPRAKNLTGGLPRPTVLERIRPAAISTTSRMSNCSRFKAGLLFAIHRQAFN